MASSRVISERMLVNLETRLAALAEMEQGLLTIGADVKLPFGTRYKANVMAEGNRQTQDDLIVAIDRIKLTLAARPADPLV